MALNGLFNTFLRCSNLSSAIQFQRWTSHSLRVAYYSTKTDQKKVKLTNYVLQKYSNYIKNLESGLAQRFPKAMTVYRGFMDGVKYFYIDVKQFMRILPKVNATGRRNFSQLTRQELELYERMPREMKKLAPVIIGSTLPGGYMVLMPIAYLFPKKMMTEHFWTPEQKIKFKDEDMTNRLRHSNAIIRLFTTSLCSQKQVMDDELWLMITAELKNKQFIFPHKYIGCIDMFKGAPFHLDNISQIHLMHLAKLHGINSIFYIKRKLKHKAHLILAMDRAIIKEGGIKRLSLEAMRDVCTLRGLYAKDLDEVTMMKWLNRWMHISVSADENSLSFLLHASAILGYNEPANRKLMKSDRSTLSKLRLNSRAALKRMTN